MNGTGHKHQVWVHLPASHAQTTKPLPVVFVTDAGYGFPLVRSIRNRVGARGQNLEEFILVGLPHEPGIPPTTAAAATTPPPTPYSTPLQSQATMLLQFTDRRRPTAITSSIKSSR